MLEMESATAAEKQCGTDKLSENDIALARLYERYGEVYIDQTTVLTCLLEIRGLIDIPILKDHLLKHQVIGRLKQLDEITNHYHSCDDQLDNLLKCVGCAGGKHGYFLLYVSLCESSVSHRGHDDAVRELKKKAKEMKVVAPDTILCACRMLHQQKLKHDDESSAGEANLADSGYEDSLIYKCHCRGDCTIQDYMNGSKCQKSEKEKFQYLNLPPDSYEALIKLDLTLSSQSGAIKSEFGKVVVDTFKRLRKKPFEEVQLETKVLVCTKNYDTEIFCHKPATNCIVGTTDHNQLEDALMQNYFSWFNFAIIKVLRNKFLFPDGNDEVLQDYEEKFSYYCIRRCFESPKTFHPKPLENLTSLVFKVEEDFWKYALHQVKKVIATVAKVINAPSHALYVKSIEEGCVEVSCYILPQFQPSCLKEIQISQLKDHNISSFKVNGMELIPQDLPCTQPEMSSDLEGYDASCEESDYEDTPSIIFKEGTFEAADDSNKEDKDFDFQSEGEEASTSHCSSSSKDRSSMESHSDGATLMEKEEPKYTEEDLMEIAESKNPIPTPDDLRESLAAFMSKVVVLLHTVKEEEMIATLKHLSPPVEQSDKPIRWFRCNASFILGRFGGHEAALVQTSKGADSRPELMPALRSLPNAKLIITLGYAYGLKSQCNLGDVLVSTSIDGIGNIRFEHGSLKFDEGRVRQTSMSTRVLNVFTKGITRWRKFICSKEGRKTKVVAGPLISSPVLVNDKVALDEYLKNNERFKGGEMEGQEVARAQLTLKEEDKRDVDFIVIKGVADFGDGSKAKGWQLTASLAAASYAEEKLRESGGNVYNCVHVGPQKLTAVSMDAFVPKMKIKYIDRLVNREKQWPPCHSNKLVKLQLVEREKGEGYCANIQRGREDKTVKRTSLAYSDLFKVERGKKPVRKVLVEGDAGIGKTTLSISLSEDWASEKLFQEFALLLLLPLRQKKVASAGSLPELLKLLHPSSDVCKAVASYVENEEEKVLIIADGWDELIDSDQEEGSFLYELLFESFPLMSVVVTSRPSASAPLHRLPCIDRFVEISGFSKEDIKEYIKSEFTSDQEKASRLLEQLEGNPLVESVCSIPLNCSIMCHLWRTLEEGLPSTMTQLYTKIILNVILRNIQKKAAFKNVLNLSNFNALPKDLQQSFKLLCRFAFQALKNNQIVFSQEELVEFFPVGLALDEKILCFGLLQSAETVLETGHGVSFHFIHLTFMEYLAALHLVEQTQSTQFQVFSKKDINSPYATSHFTIVWRFFFGIRYHFFPSKVVAGDNTVNHILRCVQEAAIPDSFLSLCHCAFEAQSNLITDEDIQFSFVYTIKAHTAHDCAALLYVIAHMEEHSCLNIDFSSSGIRDNQIKTLTDILASKQGKLQVEMLGLSGNKLTGKCVSDLFHRASPGYQSDTKLEPKSDTLTLAKSVPSRCGLSELGMSNDSSGVCGLQILVNGICGNLFSRLKELMLNGSLTSDADTNGKWLTTLMDALSTCCPHLAWLGLSQNNLGVAGASAVARGLSKLQHHSVGFRLFLEETNLGDDGLKVFVNNIKCVCYFGDLYLSGNDIHAAGVSALKDAVCSGNIDICGYDCTLDLSNNPLGLEGVTPVGIMLHSNHCKADYVDLSRCKLTTSGGDLTNTNFLKVGQQLCLLPYNCTVGVLYLDGNSFTGEGVHILAGLMHLCRSLKYLFCSDCGITSDDLILLLDKLTQLKSSSPSLCSKLGTWNLDNNAIDDRGVSYLISHLSSLLPNMGSLRGISVDSNKVSKEMETRLEEELRKLEDLRVQEELRRQVESCPSDHSSSSEDESYIESQSVGEEESMSDHTSSNDDGSSVGVYPEGEEEPNLSTPHPPPTPVTDSLSRQPVCGDQQGSCSDDETLDLRPPALKKPKHEDPVVPPSSETVYATGESPTSSHPLEDNDRVNQTGCSVGSVHFDTPTSQPLCGVTQASPLATAPDIQIGEQRSCDPSHDSCDDVEFFTPPPSPPPPQDDDTVIVNKIPTLGVCDLASVQEAVWDGRARWYYIGLQLGLSAETLDVTRLNHPHDNDSCFTETLKNWLRRADLHPSWSNLAKALRTSAVGREDLAEKLPNLDPST